jgi:hypothetical protein
MKPKAKETLHKADVLLNYVETYLKTVCILFQDLLP